MSVSVAKDTAMEANGNRVWYCCVWKEGRVLYKYSIGDHQIDNMAALCLELIPPFHRSYSETIAAHTFAFLIDHHHGFVYFAILRRHTLPNSHLLAFLHTFRDEFTNIRSASSNRDRLDDHFAPVVRRLVASLERLPQPHAWPPMNGAATEAATSTKAPLLARPCKQDKKKNNRMKNDDAVLTTDIETPEHRRSADSDTSSRIKSSPQSPRDKWCRQVRIVLAIDAAVCILLLVIWLFICHGIECIR